MMDMYALSRSFWDFSFENPEKIRPNHIALYFFTIEHCNRLGWKQKFGLPTTMVMEAIGVKSYNTFIATLNDLIEYGFIKLIEKSKNQYSSNVIALSKNDKPNNKALDKALIKHTTKQSESTVQSTIESIDSIDIPYTSIQSTIIPEKKKSEKSMEEVIEELFIDRPNIIEAVYMWSKYKDSRKEPYKTTMWLFSMDKQLQKFTEQEIIDSMHVAISSNHQGYFPKKSLGSNRQSEIFTSKFQSYEDLK